MDATTKRAIYDNHKGIQLAQQGKNRLALRYFNAAIKTYPVLPLNQSHDMRYRLYSNRGLTKEHLRDFQGALTDYNHSLNLNPHYTVGYCNRGGALYNLGHYSAAARNFKMALHQHPDYRRACFFLGMARLRAKQFSKAVKAFTQLIKTVPKIFVPYYERGCAELNLDRWRPAARDFRNAVRLNTANDYSKVATLNNWGVAENNLHHYTEAIHVLKRALRIIPGNHSTLTNLEIARKKLSSTTK